MFLDVHTSPLSEDWNDEFSEAREELQTLAQDRFLKTAVFGGGCFWCLEAPMENTPGVEAAVLGYMGGVRENPTYEQVSTDATGHREVVKVFYNPLKVSYQDLLNTYWKFVDPTDAEGQFADRGFHYTTALYFTDLEQKEIALKAIEKLNQSGRYDKKIVTEVLPASEFYPAENHHQSYYKKQSRHYKDYYRGSGRQAYVEQQASLV